MKDEPEDEGTPETPEIVVPDKDTEDYDMHDNQEGMEELIANPTGVSVPMTNCFWISNQINKFECFISMTKLACNIQNLESARVQLCSLVSVC